MQDNLFDDDDLSELSQLSSSQFTTFDFDSHGIPGPSSQDFTSIANDKGQHSLWRTRNTPRWSWIWKHGDAVTIAGKRYWQCKLCRRNPKRYADGSTKHPIKHLRTHKLTENGPMDENGSSSLIRQAFGNSIPKIHFNADVFKQLLVQWLVTSNISFRQVEESNFRLLLSYLAAVTSSYTSIPRFLPHSGNTAHAWTVQMFSQQKQSLIHLFHDIHVVHFSFDLWTSSNHYSLLGMVAHWINIDAQSCHALLGLKRLHGAHTGENQAQILMSVIEEYGLTKKVGYFTLDNATNNDVALVALSHQLKEVGVIFDPVEHRLYCLGHVINLVVKAFLYGGEIPESEVHVEVNENTLIEQLTV